MIQAVCCSVLQRVALCVVVWCSVLQCGAVYCSVFQCVAVCSSAWQCVAVCCNVLHCVAVCCSVLHMPLTSFAHAPNVKFVDVHRSKADGAYAISSVNHVFELVTHELALSLPPIHYHDSRTRSTHIHDSRTCSTHHHDSRTHSFTITIIALRRSTLTNGE